jgi:thioredoxin 1
VVIYSSFFPRNLTFEKCRKAGMVLHHVNDDSDFQSYLDASKSFGGKAVVVDFFADWCSPCKVNAPVFEALSAQYPAVTFLKVDVDKCQEVAKSMEVKAMPTFAGIFKGEKVEELVGADPRKLKAMVEKMASMAMSSTGQKVGASASASSAPAGATDDSPEARRARMAAAAEARFKGSS